MNNRKAIFLLLSIFLLVGYSQFKDVLFDRTRLPDAKDIDGSSLKNVPPVREAIQFVQDRIKENPNDAVSYVLLGELYMRQARETGDVSGYNRAEESLQKSLDLIPGYAPAGSSLASVYYARHEFEDALALATQVYESNWRDTSALAIMGDANLALGEYQKAEETYRMLEEIDATPPILARLANLAEIKGDQAEALKLIRRAAGETLTTGGSPENAAWYLLRVGDIYFHIGNMEEAGGYYEASLRVYENYHLALAGLGKVRAAQGNYDEAIDLYQRAVNIVPQPDFLAALGDLYIMTDQPELAEIQYETVETIGTLAALNEQIYNRQLANFYSDHNRNTEEALQLALTELKYRKDVYGYDAAAWAHYKNGNYNEAQEFITQTLALGTRDANLYYHAGMIALALDDKAQARMYLDEALEINPHFSILLADDAREILLTLQNIAGQ
jgi:tetratricopeptide (TPR) repeat protein